MLEQIPNVPTKRPLVLSKCTRRPDAFISSLFPVSGPQCMELRPVVNNAAVIDVRQVNLRLWARITSASHYIWAPPANFLPRHVQGQKQAHENNSRAFHHKSSIFLYVVIIQLKMIFLYVVIIQFSSPNNSINVICHRQVIKRAFLNEITLVMIWVRLG